MKLSILLLLAFLKLPLNIYGILSLSLISIVFSAIRNAISSPSIAQGPAIRKKLSDFRCLKLFIEFKSIERIFTNLSFIILIRYKEIS